MYVIEISETKRQELLEEVEKVLKYGKKLRQYLIDLGEEDEEDDDYEEDYRTLSRKERVNKSRRNNRY